MIRIHSVCFYANISLEYILKYAAGIVSRHHFLDIDISEIKI